jgi:tRNA A-37 threonylcarbamoyl transferase component Bud32
MDLGIPGLEDAEPVGQGGFATVYKARQPAFARTVAVKVLAGTHFDEDSRLRFERELHTLGLLSEHPGIVTVHGTGFTAEGRPYLTMAFVDEGTLADRLGTRGSMAWPEAVAILIRLAGALETAHRSGIIHRDIKPANVLLSRYGAQLSDFGIARIAGGHETQAGVVTASIAYASPEVMNGDRPTVLADIYSLGSTAYALLLGRSPFERSSEETFLAIMVRIQTEAPPDLREHGVPEDLAALLAQTLAKDPAERPQSSLEFGHRLQDVMRAHGRQVPELILAPDLVEDVDRSAGGTGRGSSVTAVVGGVTPGRGVPPGGTGAGGTGADGPPRSRGRLAGFLVAGGLFAAVLAGVVVAARDGGGDGGAGGAGELPSTVSETTTVPGVVVPPDTGSPETTQETQEDPPETDAPQVATVPPISDEPVCGSGEGLPATGGAPVRVILDTGVGVGVDDLGALAVLHALADTGEAEILATMVSVGGDAAAGRTVDAVNTYYRRPDLPVGVVSGPAPTGVSPYTAQIAANFPNDLVDPATAVDLYREVLAGQPDGSVTIVSNGFLTSLAELLASPPDSVSELNGQQLVAAKVNQWVAMGGAYPESTAYFDDGEFNFAEDTPAAQSAVSGWPTPAVFSGFEVGKEIMTGAVLQTATPLENPVREGYRLWGPAGNMPSFDLTAVLVAVRGTSDGAFEVCTGRNIVGSGGATTWEHRAGGPHGYVRMLAPSEEIADTLDALLTAAPAS